MKILILNGANLNMLGTREVDKYGDLTLEAIEKELFTYSFELGIVIETFQSNIEGEIAEKIQHAIKNFDGIVLNAGGYTHTSVVIRDAISAVNIPTVEVHMTNIFKREEFRHNSLIAPVCIGQITGFGKDSYKLAMKAICDYLRNG